MIKVEGGGSADDLRSLRQWLLEEEQLRGRVQLTDTPPTPGTLGPTVDSLTVALGPGGVATAVASVLVSWIRRQRSNVSVKVTRPDGTVTEVSATHVSGMEAPQLRQLTTELSRSLSLGGDSPVPGNQEGQVTQ